MQSPAAGKVDVERFRVRAYRSDQGPKVVALWDEMYAGKGLEQRQKLFEWITSGNPNLAEDGGYFLLWDDERLAGMHGHMPVCFSMKGELVRGYIAHDDLLGRDYRGKGLGAVMLSGVQQACPVFACALWFNEPNYRMYMKSGWIPVTGFFTYVRVVDPTYLVKRVLGSGQVANVIGRILKQLLTVGYSLVQGRHRRFEIRSIERFDSRFDDLAREVSSQMGIAVTRTSPYLNWKFVVRPYATYRILAAFSESEVVGYSVFRVKGLGSETVGILVDVFADERHTGVLDALLVRAIEELIECNVSRIVAAASYPPLVRNLRRLGFFRAKQETRFAIRNGGDEAATQYAKNINHWYLTLSDGDGDAWDAAVGDR